MIITEKCAYHPIVSSDLVRVFLRYYCKLLFGQLLCILNSFVPKVKILEIFFENLKRIFSTQIISCDLFFSI